MQQKLIKIISVLLVTSMLYANSAAVISYAADNFLSNQELENQGTSTKNENVEFDVFYDGGKHSAVIDISNTDTKLNIALNVKKAGYLKDAVVDFSDSNFTIAQEGESESIQKIDTEEKKVIFNQINNGTNLMEKVAIAADRKDEVEAGMFKKDNKVKFSATYINEKAKEVAIEKTLVINTEWNIQTAKANLQYEITKYIPYSENGANEIITQGKITSSVENSILPIKETNLEITAPKINNTNPSKVTVVANTNTTNGDQKGEKFTQDNWNYDSETGKVTINVKNEEVNGKVKWVKNTADEYLVTYIYSEDVFNAVKDSIVRLTYDVNSKISLYSTGKANVSAHVDGYQDQKDSLGKIIEYQLEVTPSLSKGYIYNNRNASDENKKETPYSTKITANISYADRINSIVLGKDHSEFITSDGKTLAISGVPEHVTSFVYPDVYESNKTIKVSKAELEKILGEEWQLELYTGFFSGSATDVINKESLVKEDSRAKEENGIITIYISGTCCLSIRTSKPQQEGQITFEIESAIAKDVKYSEQQLRNLKNLKTPISVGGETIEHNIELQEPTQKSGLTISSNRLSTVAKNQDVEIKVTLENDSEDDTMYTNPTVKVDLPENIEEINVKEAKIYFDDELTIKEAKILNNDDGTKSLVAEIQGTQTKYNNVAAKGATVVFKSDITLNILTPTSDKTITATVTNGETVTTNEQQIKYVAPTGVVPMNSLQIGDVELSEGETKVPVKQQAQNAKFVGYVINNYENTLNNVAILGRLPFAGNKDVDAGINYGTNINVTLKTPVTVNFKYGSEREPNSATVYYSENGEATTDLSNTANGWTTEVADYSRVKSYMITLNSEVKSGDIAYFNYDEEIPANLDYDQVAYSNYTAYYENNLPTGTIKDKTNAKRVGITTGTVAKLEAKLSSDMPEKVESGNDLTYKLKINNIGNLDAENVTIRIQYPSWLLYTPGEGEEYTDDYLKVLVEEDEEVKTENNGNEEIDEEENNVGDLELGEGEEYDEDEEDEDEVIEDNPGEEQEKQEYYRYDYNTKILEIKLNNVKSGESIEKLLKFMTMPADEEKQITMKADIIYNNETVDIETNAIKVIVTPKYFNASAMTNTPIEIKEGDSFQYRLYVSSTQSEERKNTVAKITLPDELKYESIKIEGEDASGSVQDLTDSINIEKRNNIITVNLGSIGRTNERKIIIETTANKLPNGTFKKDGVISATIKADNTVEEKVEDKNVQVNKPGFKISQTCNIPEGTTIAFNEQFTYVFTVENLSNLLIQDINVRDYIPNEVQFERIEIIYADGSIVSTYNKNNEAIEAIVNLFPEQKVVVKFHVKAKAIEKNTQITNKCEATHEQIETVKSNEISHTIKLFEDGDMQNIPGYGNGNTGETKKVIGTIWIDENKDGVKDANETKVSNVKVLLLDNNNGNVITSQTGDNGAYMFNNIAKGRYTVIFLYDSSNYSPTIYKKAGVDNSMNSDAIDKEVVFEGKLQVAAVTEEIVLNEENQYDIDLGLIPDPKFDLKLDKIVKSVTVNNSKSAKTHDYNSKLAKVDIEAKYANSSTIVVEYKLTVTNEGGIAGYVKKLADYLPKEMKFNSELNKDWYEGKDGVIYNNSLANTVINPGESKEVLLVLTKNMNSESFGLINNSAEIFETSNDYGALDIDSTPGNKAGNEDDYSTANVLTAVKTGEIIIYTTLTLTVIAIIGVGIYMIKKKVLN